MEFEHKSVLLEQTIDNLNIRPDGIYVDGTLGGGGHAGAVMDRLKDGLLIGVDQDGDAIEAALKRLGPCGAVYAEPDDMPLPTEYNGGGTRPRGLVFRRNFEEVPELLRRLGLPGVDGIVLDLGVSSFQLDEGERGFSYRFDAPLDMRMDRRSSLTAAVIVNEWPVEEIARVLREYGEERFAGNIARNIGRFREERPVETTFELNGIIADSIPARMRAKGGHPSKRSFQALRIACNRELEVLERSLDGLIDALLPGGRICVISFHSLEDRIVKNIFKKAQDPCICPPGMPACVCGRVSKGRVITRHPVLPDENELEHNKRASSAKLRVFEKSEGAKDASQISVR